jgi:hypothetical protein
MRNTIAGTLQEFDTIALTALDRAELMDRTETKFVMNSSQLPPFIERLKTDYAVLEVNGDRVQSYESLYYDTPGFRLYHDHHRGMMGRFKIRFRNYVESRISYLEIKFKNNKDRTIKDRMLIPRTEPTIGVLEEDFLFEKSSFRPPDLEPKLWANCSRITLVSKLAAERITIDFALRFKNNEKDVSLPHLSIVEIKQSNYFLSPGIRALRLLKVRSGSISKYCYGVTLLYHDLKKNNFKPALLQINKINHENSF